MKNFLLSCWPLKQNQPISLLVIATITRFFLCCIPETNAREQAIQTQEKDLPQLTVSVRTSEKALTFYFEPLTRSGTGVGAVVPYLKLFDMYLNQNRIDEDTEIHLDLSNLDFTAQSVAAFVRYIKGVTKISDQSHAALLQRQLKRIDFSGNKIGEENVDGAALSSWFFLLNKQYGMTFDLSGNPVEAIIKSNEKFNCILHKYN